MNYRALFCKKKKNSLFSSLRSVDSTHIRRGEIRPSKRPLKPFSPLFPSFHRASPKYTRKSPVPDFLCFFPPPRVLLQSLGIRISNSGFLLLISFLQFGFRISRKSMVSFLWSLRSPKKSKVIFGFRWSFWRRGSDFPPFIFQIGLFCWNLSKEVSFF